MLSACTIAAGGTNGIAELLEAINPIANPKTDALIKFEPSTLR
jgi:hypothetical protein